MCDCNNDHCKQNMHKLQILEQPFDDNNIISDEHFKELQNFTTKDINSTHFQNIACTYQKYSSRLKKTVYLYNTLYFSYKIGKFILL